MNSVLDGFRALAEELGMNDEIRDDLLRSFVERCHGFLESLKEVLETGDEDLFERTTHSLKGLAGNMRFHRLSELNESFTDAVRQGEKENAHRVLADLDAEYVNIEKAITPVVEA